MRLRSRSLRQRRTPNASSDYLCYVIHFDCRIYDKRRTGGRTMIQCPRCRGPLTWQNYQTEWACSSCGLVLARLEQRPRTSFFSCALCGKNLGDPLHSCICWKTRNFTQDPLYIASLRSNIGKEVT